MWKHLYTLPLLLVLSRLTVANAATDSPIVTVTSGPSKDKTCSAPDAIVPGNYAKIHFAVSIDASSTSGEPGKVMESTQAGDPIGVTLGHGEVIPAWDQGLMGLCAGDKVTLVVPPSLAYGDEGTGDGEHDIPGGATVKFDIEIVSVLEAPSEDEDTEQATAMFTAADENGDGKLSRAEFDAMFAAQIGDVADAEEMNAIQLQLDHFWAAQDHDGDGFLLLEEFLAPSSFDAHDDSDDPEEEFNALDTDKDGKLSKEEVTEFFTSLGQEVPDDFWLHLDENKDGFISFDEFFVEGEYDDGEDEEEPDL
jgi:FKBP-type peptidyl-prolyl cis-trans isomerase 2